MVYFSNLARCISQILQAVHISQIMPSLASLVSADRSLLGDQLLLQLQTKVYDQPNNLWPESYCCQPYNLEKSEPRPNKGPKLDLVRLCSNHKSEDDFWPNAICPSIIVWKVNSPKAKAGLASSKELSGSWPSQPFSSFLYLCTWAMFDPAPPQNPFWP